MRRPGIVALALLFTASCGDCSGGGAGSGSAGTAASAERGSADQVGADAAGAAGSGSGSGASGRAREPGAPAVEDARLLGGASARACTGAEVDLAAALFDPGCAIGSGEARRLAAAFEDGGVAHASLRQEAKLLGQGRVLVRLVNAGPTAVALPLSWHPAIATFTALAEDPAHRIIDELAPPHLELPARDAGARGDAADSGAPRARFARVVLPPGGAGLLRATVGTAVAKRIAPACEGPGSCAPPRLPPGKYVLHIGELLVDVEAGAPARVPWDVTN